MKAFWILPFATFSFAILVIEAQEDKNQQLKKWEHWNQVKKTVKEQPRNYNCSVLPTRLLDWFHILRTSHIKQDFKRKGILLSRLIEVIPRMKTKEAKIPFPSGFDRSHCREPIKTVFHDVFDQNKDGILSNSELQEMYEIGNEAPCINQFFKNCSGGKETFTEAEFCNCFSSVEPPCAHNLRTNLPFLLVRGVSRGITGFYYPSCDQDGFYMPRQCRVTDNQGTKECWCVDRHGSKIEGMMECVDNTEPPKEDEEPAN